MDYSKSGSGMGGKKSPTRHLEHNQKGSSKNPFGDKGNAGDGARDGARDDKAELLARMKAAAGARKKD